MPPADTGVEALSALRERLVGLRGKVQWLRSLRKHWDRLVTKTGRSLRQLEPDGEGAAELLVTQKDILEGVRAWYGRQQIGRLLEVQAAQPPRHRVLLRPESGPLLDIDLLDTGEGMVQVMPVLVAASLAKAAGSGHLLAIEDPETHLHGDAQRALAEHLAELGAGESPPTIVIETHSRLLLLALQLAVAKRALPRERVAVYWFDQESTGRSTATRIELDENGQPISGWPRSAFDEDQQLADELLSLQLESGARG